jgi:hypothetical protein
MIYTSKPRLGDVRVIRCSDLQKDGWGIQLDFADGSHRTEFIGSQDEATQAMMDVLERMG